MTTSPVQAVVAAVVAAVLRETLKMVDALNPPPAGSYNLGHHNGIIAAVETVRDLLPRAIAGTYPFKESDRLESAQAAGAGENWRDSASAPDCPTIKDDEPVRIQWRDSQKRRCTKWISAQELGDLVTADSNARLAHPTPVAADAGLSDGAVSEAFEAWWEESGQGAEMSLTTKNCANAAFHAALRRLGARGVDERSVVETLARWFASGPESCFFADNYTLAEHLIRQAGFDRDDWTITDLHDPTGEAALARPEGSP